jgi:hypothetical protein
LSYFWFRVLLTALCESPQGYSLKFPS